MRFVGRIEANQLPQHLSLSSRRLRREGAIPIGRRGVGPFVIVPAEMEAEQDVDQGGPQLADGDVGFPAKMNRLEHLEQALLGSPAAIVRLGVGQHIGSEQSGCTQDLAAILCRARPAGRPDLLRVLTAIETVQKALEKAGFDGRFADGNASDQRTLIEADESDVRSGSRCLVVEEIVERLRQRCLPAKAMFRAFNPLQQAAVVDREKMDNIRGRRAAPKGRQELVQQCIGRTSLPRRRSVEIHAHDQAVVRPPFEYSGRGRVIAEAQTPGEMLKQCGLAVTGVAAQDDETDPPFQDVAVQCLFQVRLDIGAGGELGVETACLAIAPPRAGIGLQQGLQPTHLVRVSFRTFDRCILLDGRPDRLASV